MSARSGDLFGDVGAFGCDDETFGVYPVRSAGHQRHEILAWHHLVETRVGRFDDAKGGDPIPDGAAEGLYVYRVAPAQFVETGEQQGVRQATMAREHAVGGFAADRQVP
nr:hypothetical protein [Bifidobacterium bohemicum]